MNSRDLVIALEDLLDRYEFALDASQDRLSEMRRAGFQAEIETLRGSPAFQAWAAAPSLQDRELRERLRDFLMDEVPSLQGILPAPLAGPPDPDGALRAWVLAEVVAPMLVELPEPVARAPWTPPRPPAGGWLRPLRVVAATILVATGVAWQVGFSGVEHRPPTLAVHDGEGEDPGGLPPYYLEDAEGERVRPTLLDFALEVSGPLVEGRTLLRFPVLSQDSGSQAVFRGALPPGTWVVDAPTTRPPPGPDGREVPRFDPRAALRTEKSVAVIAGEALEVELVWRGVFLAGPGGTREVSLPLVGQGKASTVRLHVTRNGPGGVEFPSWLEAPPDEPGGAHRWDVTRRDVTPSADLKVVMRAGEGEPDIYRLVRGDDQLLVGRTGQWALGRRVSWEVLVDGSQALATVATRRLGFLRELITGLAAEGRRPRVRVLDDEDQELPENDPVGALEARGFMGGRGAFLGGLATARRTPSAPPRRVLVTGGPAPTGPRAKEFLAHAAEGGPLHVVVLGRAERGTGIWSALAARTGGRLLEVSLVEGPVAAARRVLEAVWKAPPRRNRLFSGARTVAARWDNGDEAVWELPVGAIFEASRGERRLATTLPMRSTPWMPPGQTPQASTAKPGRLKCLATSSENQAPPELLLDGQRVSTDHTGGMVLETALPRWALESGRRVLDPSLLAAKVKRRPRDRLLRALYSASLTAESRVEERLRAAGDWRRVDPTSVLALEALAAARFQTGDHEGAQRAVQGVLALGDRSVQRATFFRALVEYPGADFDAVGDRLRLDGLDRARAELLRGRYAAAVQAYMNELGVGSLARARSEHENFGARRELAFSLRRWRASDPGKSEEIEALAARRRIDLTADAEELVWLIPGADTICLGLYALDEAGEEVGPGRPPTRSGAALFSTANGDSFAWVPGRTRAFGVRVTGCGEVGIGAARGTLIRLDSTGTAEAYEYGGPLVRPCPADAPVRRVWPAKPLSE